MVGVSGVLSITLGELLLLVVGVALILLGVLTVVARGRVGAGLRVRRSLSVAVAVGGVLCVIAGVILLASPSDRLPAGAVKVVISDGLGKGEAADREEVRVFLDGREVGVLNVDKVLRPTAQVMVTVAKAGTHRYRTDATSQVGTRSAIADTHGGTVFIDGKTSLVILHDSQIQGRTYLSPRL